MFFVHPPQAVGMFCDPNDKQCRKKYYRMKLKAAETRACLLAFESIWKEKMDRTNDVHIWIKNGLESSAAMDGILEKNKDAWNVPVIEKEQLIALANRYAVCSTVLCKHFERENRKLFQCGTFKSHWLKHAILMSDYLNPRHTWCVAGESYMSVCKQLMFSCLKGRGALASIQKFMQRYVIAVTLQLHRETWRIQ